MRIFLLLFLMGFASCKSQKKSPESKSASVKAIALEKLGSSSSTSHEMDSSETLILYKNYSEKSSVEQNTGVRFLVIDTNTKKVIAEQNIGRGTVEWYRDKVLIIRLMPGIIKDGETMDDYAYLLDPITMKKTKLSKNDIEKL